MKKRKVTVVTSLLACAMLTLSACGSSANEAAETVDFGIFTEVAGDGTTYVPLFDVISVEKYDDYWVEKCLEVLGGEDEDTARFYADYLENYSHDLYGAEAVEAYADGEIAFDNAFINGPETLTFEGNTVTIVGTDGSSETYTYEYIGVYTIGEGESMLYGGVEYPVNFDVDVYQATEDAGEFTYFLLRDDTMDETFHIEFRYGSDLEELCQFLTGEYAYWLAAGIDQDASEETIYQCIDLFITENVG